MARPFGLGEHVFDVHDGGLEVVEEIKKLNRNFVSKIRLERRTTSKSSSNGFFKCLEVLWSPQCHLLVDARSNKYSVSKHVPFQSDISCVLTAANASQSTFSEPNDQPPVAACKKKIKEIRRCKRRCEGVENDDGG